MLRIGTNQSYAVTRTEEKHTDQYTAIEIPSEPSRSLLLDNMRCCREFVDSIHPDAMQTLTQATFQPGKDRLTDPDASNMYGGAQSMN